jgi:mannosylglycoprotein endo-beta-mannosidase
VWSRPVAGGTTIHRWNNKIYSLRKHLSGWAHHVSGHYKKEKKRLSEIIDNIESLTESRVLLQHELEMKNKANEQIARLLREEEVKWYQRSKAQFLLEGDSNTKYFHMVANGHHRKKYIHSLH